MFKFSHAAWHVPQDFLPWEPRRPLGMLHTVRLWTDHRVTNTTMDVVGQLCVWDPVFKSVFFFFSIY
jgi:hypothetical protein